MDPQNAIRLLDDTFDSSYDEGRFLNFINELFNGFDVSHKKHLVPDAHKEYIDSDNYKSLGGYKDGSGKLIDVLAIKLKKSTSRDRARTMQRNLVAKYLSENNKHAALVAFYGYDPEDWRFSFVKLDYRLEKGDSGKVKTVEDLTPAKRYSFLVGVNEPNHTCRSQFLGLIKEEDQNPSFEEIETAFSIEKVTKEFFEKYKGLFLELKDALDEAIESDPYIKEDFIEKDLSTIDFAKKLLGQIVFLYFLQKKGWLGVERDKKTHKFKEWGSGPKNFLKKLFDKEIVQYDNFFNDVLEPLFYEALAREHDGDYYSRFECKIPFLNGGLFEPINDYNWQETDILLDNTIFEKIVGTFNEFNFTVKEDEPLEKEVAVDPEMLGKVFENLLDVKDRKSKGAFYTPREIVHYMCQQSLINYLETNTKDKGIPREDFEMFIQFGDYSSSADQKYLIEINKLLHDIKSGRSKNVVKSQEQIQKLIGKLTLPNSIISNKELIDRLLADVKVVDPAVGSGAFPVGMMNEIVKARSILTIFWFDDAKSDEQTTYNIKRQTIQNCLYGVDLDSSAVDITKLRFWLSLIVDEDDMEHIQPLPNLDNKIMCGNSLLEEFEGVKLFDENMLGEPVIDHSFEIEQIDSKIDGLNEKLHKIYTGKSADDGDPKQIKKQISRLENEKKKLLLAPKEKTQQLNLSDADNFRIKQSQRKLRGLRALQKQFFDAQSKKEKTKLRDDIDNLEWELIEETLKEDGNEESIQKLQQYKKSKSKPFFLWKLYFAEVFQRENPGFDVVIANPPYIGQKGNKEIFRKIKETSLGKRFHQRRMDIFYFFFHISLDLTRDFGQIAFITTNYYLTATYADKLRNDFSERGCIQKIINFNELKIFESALGQHNLITIMRKGLDNNSIAETSITKRKGVASENTLKNILSESDKETEYFYIKQNELYDEDNGHIRLIKSSDIHASPIDLILDKIKDMGTKLGLMCELNQGIVTGADKLSKSHMKKYCVEGEKGDGIFVLSNEDKSKLALTHTETEILKPWFKNSNVHKWFTDMNNSEYLIYYTSKGDYKETPNFNKHFTKYKHILINRNARDSFVTLDDYDLFVKGGKKISYVMIASAFKRGDFYCVSYARNERIFNSAKIVAPQRSGSNIFGYNESPWFASADVYFITPDNPNINLKYVLSLLNSTLYYVWLYNRGKRKGEYLELYLIPLSEIPIKEISPEKQISFINLVDQILGITKDADYLDNPDKQANVKNLENQIDHLVYKLYDLTPEEIKIVEEFNEGK